jgi:hydrogenase maturation protease
MRILVLGLGNDLLTDDAVGILAARDLKRELDGTPGVTVLESPLHGVALLDLFVGHDKAIVLDAIQSGRASPGTITELRPSDLGGVKAPSPHFAGLPELLVLARELDLEFPEAIVIFAVEVADQRTIGGTLSAPVRQALPELVSKASALVRSWIAAG